MLSFCSARAKETLEWLSNDIFGKVVQLKKGVTIDRDRTSVNLNENMDSLVPGSKIADMPTGWICGQTARDFVKTKTGRNDSMDIQESEEFQSSRLPNSSARPILIWRRFREKKPTMPIIPFLSSIISTPQRCGSVSCILIFFKSIKM